ncbi:MAG TPA: PIG-L family deacetylase [Anaerolineales bacterium]|nr:PIG-L family deacetylase [Anaerolineales bacterium]
MSGDGFRLLAVLAHPDDESNGLGGVFARYHAEGVKTYLITATRGQRGWQGSREENPGLEALGKIREHELLSSAAILGIEEVVVLDFMDGDLDQANPLEAVAQISAHIRRIRPQVVLTFPPDGIYGHPDHIAVSQFTTAAVVHAGSANPAHRVDKLYYAVSDRQELEAYQPVFGDLVMEIDGQKRAAVYWEDWAITTRIETAAYTDLVYRSVRCHRSQLLGAATLGGLSPADQKNLWGVYKFYRAMSLVNGGRALEQDLFEGI